MDEKWIEIFGRMTYGLYVLTTCHEGLHNGMIASWVSQVSHNPPLLMVAPLTKSTCPPTPLTCFSPMDSEQI